MEDPMQTNSPGDTLAGNAAAAAPGKPADIRLPAPRMTGGKSLMDALKQRHSTRKFSAAPLPLQELAEVLWSAFGLTREFAGTGIHTPGSHSAPAAHNWQEIDLFVATAAGLYRYDPREHRLEGVRGGDIRYLTAHQEQPFVLDAPVILIYVADLARMNDAGDWDKGIFPWADTAVMAENVYLYCASADLATVVRALFARPPLAGAMGLGPDHVVTFSQPVGYPG
jgi:nitroreductase